MYDGSDVQVVKQKGANESYMDDTINASMAGLSDMSMSMGDIKRLDDTTDDQNFSMAEVPSDDLNDTDNGETGHKSSNLPKGNILDALKTDTDYLKVKE